MSFESSISKGRIATLLIVLLPIISSIVYVPFYVFRLSTSNIIYLSVILSALSYVGYILLLVAMHSLSKIYGDKRIFRNSLYGFTATIVGAIAFTIVLYAFLVPRLNELSAYSTSPSSAPPQLSFFISFLQVIVVIWLGAAVIAILNGFFYRRAFYALAEKSGEGNFRTAGLLMIIGGALTIVFVGGLIFFIGWIVATMGFSSMKSIPTQASPLPPQEIRAQATAQKKQCPNCGAENSIDAIYCSHCGIRL